MSHYIILDLEWNQNPHRRSGDDEILPFEIIEIGAVRLNDRLEIESEFDRLIRPCVYRKMHKKIYEVTHISMEELDRKGIRFRDAITQFLDWCGNDPVFCTWGSMDLTELQRNMVYHGIELPFDLPFLYYDLQKVYSLIKGERTKDSLDTAVAELHIDTVRPFHHALDDAWYTACVMQRMNFFSRSKYVSVDYYRLPEPKSEFILHFPDYDKFVTHPYETREEALSDRKLTQVVCCQCQRALRKKIRWFSSNQRFYYCLAVCPEHGYVKGKIRIKKAEDGGVFAVKTTKITDQSGIDLVISKKEDVRRKRSERAKRLKLHSLDENAAQSANQSHRSSSRRKIMDR
ncbi:MAG: exonuclease domain-containing protein [Clostridium sp.]|nr:exonuclease domain-containing protein [Clostridium sp.]